MAVSVIYAPPCSDKMLDRSNVRKEGCISGSQFETVVHGGEGITVAGVRQVSRYICALETCFNTVLKQ